MINIISVDSYKEIRNKIATYNEMVNKYKGSPISLEEQKNLMQEYKKLVMSIYLDDFEPCIYDKFIPNYKEYLVSTIDNSYMEIEENKIPKF